MTIKKRFIAGAVCPKCSAMDRIVIYREKDKDYRECVACGFADEMRFHNKQRELETRVNTSEQEKIEQTQVVTIVPLDQKPAR